MSDGFGSDRVADGESTPTEPARSRGQVQARGSIASRFGPRAGGVIFATAMLLASVSVIALNVHETNVERVWDGVGFLFAASIPPDMTVLEVGIRGLLETLTIAYLGTFVGVLVSLPISLLATRPLFPRYVNTPARWLLAGVRVLPSILWAVIFVILVGTGPSAGVLAITLYTIGFVGKLEYEAFEGLDDSPREAVGALGASRLQVLRFVVVPQALATIIGLAFFMFEYNVRHASAIGIVGAGGIGYYIMSYLDFFAYDRAIVLLALVFLVVVAIDELSYWLRSLFLGDAAPSTGR